MKIKIPLHKVMSTGAYGIANINNKSYVTPGWIEVPVGTTVSDIEIEYPVTNVVHSRTLHKVKGSGHNVYDVIIDNVNGNSCSCVGFTYHRNCKHLKSIVK